MFPRAASMKKFSKSRASCVHQERFSGRYIPKTVSARSWMSSYWPSRVSILLTGSMTVMLW